VERRNVRRELNADAVVRSSSQGRVGGHVIDISEHGCKLELEVDRMLPEQRLMIKLPNLETQAGVVRWVSGRIVGVEFHEPLHSAVVEHLSQKRYTIRFG
jgi:hypothetical protein